jgi:hypothetical protein
VAGNHVRARAIILVDKQRADQIPEITRNVVLVFGEIRPFVFSDLQLLVDLFAFGGMEGCFADGERVAMLLSKRRESISKLTQ